MLFASTKKTIILLLLLAACFNCFGNSDNPPERAVPYITQKNTGNSKPTPEDKTLLLQISSDHNKLLLTTLVFTLFSSVFTYYLIRAKHKRERLFEGYLAETRIAKKIHDEIANEVYDTLNFLNSKKDIPADLKENLLTRLDDIYFMTKNISREASNIDTGLNFPEQLQTMLSAYSNDTINVILKGIENIDWNTIDTIKKITTYRSLQELMVNMKKHSNATLVIIDFHPDEKKIEIHYSDNGCGATDEDLLKKNGLANVENRIAAIDGTVEFKINSGKGFHAQLTYPASTYVQKNFNNRRYRQH